MDELCAEECIEECAEEGAEEFVDTDGEREEKAWRLLDAADNSESLEMRVMDRDLATASTEFFLVWVGERWGIIGAGVGSGSAGAAAAGFALAGLKYPER